MIIHGQVDVNQAIFKNYFSIWLESILKFFFCETSESFESKLGWNVPYMDIYKMFVFVSIHHPRMSRCPPSEYSYIATK
jgi:hypothetical protein